MIALLNHCHEAASLPDDGGASLIGLAVGALFVIAGLIVGRIVR